MSPLKEFNHALPGHPGVAVRDPPLPDALVGYRLETLESFVAGAGLWLLRVLPGLWSRSPGLAVNEQDLLLLCRHD